MSHVATVDVEIRDLESLKLAAHNLGLEFRENQKTYRWYGRWVNDYHGDDAAYQHGVKPEDYGKCLHAIGIPNDSRAYEVGVIRNPNGAGYSLIWDFFSGGKGLKSRIGDKGHRLTQEYAAVHSQRQLMAQGYSVTRTTAPDGTIKLYATQ